MAVPIDNVVKNACTYFALKKLYKDNFTVFVSILGLLYESIIIVKIKNVFAYGEVVDITRTIRIFEVENISGVYFFL